MPYPSFSALRDSRDSSESIKSSAPTPARGSAKTWLPVLSAAVCFFAFVGYAFLAPTEYDAVARISVSVATARSERAELAPAQAQTRLLGLLLGRNQSSGVRPEQARFTPSDALLNRVGPSLAVETVDARVFQLSLKAGDASEAAESCNTIAKYAVIRVIELFPPGSSAHVLQAAIVPAAPSSPNRPLLLLLGVAVGAVAATLSMLGTSQGWLASVSVPLLPRREGASDAPPPVSSRKSVRIPVAAPVAPEPQSARPRLPFQRTMTQTFGSVPVEEQRVSDRVALPRVTLFQTQWKASRLLEPDVRAQLCDHILSEPARGCLVVGVTSASEFAQEKSLVAAEIALILANIAEPRVLLVEADFLSAKVHQLLEIEVPWVAGFSHQLQTRETQSEEPWRLGECLPTLHVLAEGAMRSPGAILSHQFERCIRKLRLCYDFIIIDGPSLAAGVDCQALNEVTDAIILVTRAGDLRGRADDPRTAKFDAKRFLIDEDF